MRATAFEYKFRFFIHGIIYTLGFLAPWLFWPPAADVMGLPGKYTWLVLSTAISSHGFLRFIVAIKLLLLLSLLFAGLGAWLRLWGSAYVGTSIVQSRDMHAKTMLADGPYRHTRNPLYLGTLLHTIGLALIMPPSGAVVAIVLIWVFQFRLALAEEPFLAARFGQPYLDYKAVVPRFLPSPKPLVPSAGRKPHWLQSLLGELYFVAAFFVIAISGWSFVLGRTDDASPIRQGIIISLGVWLIVRALMPRKAPTENSTT